MLGLIHINTHATFTFNFDFISIHIFLQMHQEIQHIHIGILRQLEWRKWVLSLYGAWDQLHTDFYAICRWESFQGLLPGSSCKDIKSCYGDDLLLRLFNSRNSIFHIDAIRRFYINSLRTVYATTDWVTIYPTNGSVLVRHQTTTRTTTYFRSASLWMNLS